jgi:hypothetical protein
MQIKTLVTVVRPTLICSAFALFVAGCGHGPDSEHNNSDTAQAAQASQAPTPNAPILLRGTVVSDSADQLVLKSDTGLVNVKLTQPLHVFNQVSSNLAAVKDSTFIGVTTVKQPDGTERATEIHVFPEELRGLGEGSRMMTPDTSTNARRMTNGNVSASRMTNGAVAQSRMSNGNVSSTNGTSLVVQYAGGSQNVTVPPNTPVTEIKLASKALASGDSVIVLAAKAADGSLTSDKVLYTAKR